MKSMFLNDKRDMKLGKINQAFVVYKSAAAHE
jgi:hypothetical protein